MAEIGSLRHRETWSFRINRGGAGDDWPDLVTGVSRQVTVRPEAILLTLDRPEPPTAWAEPGLAVEGAVLKGDGTPGARRKTIHYWSRNEPPEWVRQLAWQFRRRYDLGPGKTGVGW